ncbi:MAG: site-2 protease family protein [Armatimonadetes bacterium]|nr:site-2 protease family protein [Armatimonadota bacterium]
MGGLKIGKILGFEISIDWSWLLIFLLVTYTLAMGYFPAFYPSFNTTTNWIMGVLAALALFASVLVHELSHSVVARRFGTEVKGIMLFLFGGMSQTANEPKSAAEEFWMAIAGPITSFVLAIGFYLLGIAGVAALWPKPVIAVLGYLALINLILGIFNMVPGFPLDGGRVLRSAIWAWTDDLPKATRYASNAGQVFGYALMAFGFLNILRGNLVGGLWLIFIGWFLSGAARQSYQQMMMRKALTGVRVEQVMTTNVPAVPADLSIRQFVEDMLLNNEYSCYPVIQNDEVIGVIGIEEVRMIPSEKWDFVRVGEIQRHIDSAYEISMEDDAWEALSKLADQSVCRLVVMDNNHLKGTVGRESVFKLLQTKIQMGM